MNSAVIAANKIKNKHRRKIIGNKKNKKDNDDDDKNKKTSTEWLKAADYLDTKDQDAIRYLYVPPKKTNEPSTDVGHYIRSEIDNVNLKQSNLATKITAKNIIKKYRNLARKKPYKTPSISYTEPANAEEIDRTDTIETLEDIASLQPGKSAQLVVKKISEKYKKMREAHRSKNIFKLPGEVTTIETVETPQGNAEEPVSVPKPNISKIRTAKKSVKNIKN